MRMLWGETIKKLEMRWLDLLAGSGVRVFPATEVDKAPAQFRHGIEWHQNQHRIHPINYYYTSLYKHRSR
jgi:hypothetical protein